MSMDARTTQSCMLLVHWYAFESSSDTGWLRCCRVDPRRSGLKTILLKGNRLGKRLLRRSG